jgi:hypothetical protein
VIGGGKVIIDKRLGANSATTVYKTSIGIEFNIQYGEQGKNVDNHVQNVIVKWNKQHKFYNGIKSEM